MAEALRSRHVPQRTCVACGRKQAKSSLLRLVRTRHCGVVLPAGARVYGRSAYLCMDPDCVRRARQAKRVERALKAAVPDCVWAQASEIVEATKEVGGAGDRTSSFLH